MTDVFSEFVASMRQAVQELSLAPAGTPEARLRESLRAALDAYDAGSDHPSPEVADAYRRGWMDSRQEGRSG